MYADHMTHTTNITTAPNARQAEIDGRIAEANVVYAKATQNAAWYAKHFRTQLDGAAKAAEAHKAMDEALLALDAVNAEYEGWSRFFLVQASNGHIHKSLWCSTCFPTTQYAWLPELSGLTEAEAVAEYGGILCSICFPSAPVEWTTGTNKKDAERKAAEAAMKAIAKTPEGKAVVRKRDIVRSSEYALRSIQRRIDRQIYTERYDYTKDCMVPCSIEEIAAQQRENDEASAEREVVVAKMARPRRSSTSPRRR